MPRLTPHQRETLDRLTRVSARVGWVRISPEGFGSRGAIAHLEDKGEVETRREYGVRGGEILFARPIR